jgi:NAD(P)-dependent dehydrogenase (short-subunit alcohol dehydrogenase family)
MRSNRFQGQTAVITGAGSGIGRQTAIAFAQAGAQLVLAGRRAGALHETGAEVERAGSVFAAIETDITSESSVAATFAQAGAHFGRVDIVVNCAGIVRLGAIDTTEVEAFEQVLTVNTLGTWLSMKHGIRAMKDSGGGVIVNLGSNIGSHLTRPGMGAYAASKAAVTVLTRTAALEAIGHGIRINAVSPGPVDTPLSYRPGEDQAARDERIVATNPSKRVARPDEVAAAILWLCSEAAAYMVGQDIVLDGGASV